MNVETLLNNFEVVTEAPGGVDRLREVILCLAVQGKLFRDTDLTKWQPGVSLKDFGRMIRGITYAKAESSKESAPNFVPLLGAANIQRSINYEGLTFVASSLIKPDQYLKDGDVLICMSSGSKHLVGKTGVVRNPPVSSFGAFCGVFRISDEKNRDYLATFFKSPMYRTAISAASRGIGINNLRVGDIESIALALPPAAEQKRIVAKVDELMALCDQLEQAKKQRDEIRTAARKSAIDAISTATTPEELQTAWKRINNNWEVIADIPESIGAIRQLVLDLAVRGQLVEHESDHNAAEQFIERFSSKLTQGSSPVESAPFNVPTTWRWAHFSDVSINRDKERIPLSQSEREGRQGEYDYYGASGVIDEINDYIFDKTLLLIGEDGANLINRSTPIAFLATGKFWVNNHAHVIDSLDLDALRYLEIVINQMDLKPFLTGTAQPKLNQAKLNKILVPVPPHSEQRRIVRRVDELMALCDQLESELNSRSEVAEKFALSVVSAA